MQFENSVNLEGRVQQTFTLVTGKSVILDAGVYDVWADGDVYLKTNADIASAAPTANTGYLLRSGNTVPVQLAKPGYLFGAAGTATNVFFHKVG